MNVDTRGPRSAPFAPEVFSRLEEILNLHADLPVPEQAGRPIAIRRRT